MPFGPPRVLAERDRYFVVAPVQAHLVWPQQHMPGPRLDRPSEIGRRGPVLGDREVRLVAAAPPPEPWTRRAHAARIKDANVERVAPEELGVRSNSLRIGVHDLHR